MRKRGIEYIARFNPWHSSKKIGVVMPVFVNSDETMATASYGLPDKGADEGNDDTAGAKLHVLNGTQSGIQIPATQRANHGPGGDSHNLGIRINGSANNKDNSQLPVPCNAGLRNGLVGLDITHNPEGCFTPIGSPADEEYLARTPTDGGSFGSQSLWPDGHSYLEWDELFALTDYVRQGYYEQYPCNNNDLELIEARNGGPTSPHRGDNGTDGVDKSSTSDLFDVFINPAAYSGSDVDENDSVFSSNDSESVVSETDSDISRPKKSSLRDPKRPKTPPGTPSRKSVRFADALGLDLETVRHILEMDPCPSPPVPNHPLDIACQRKGKSVRLCFEQPGGRPDFLSRLHQQSICLENVVVSNMTVMGTIKVRNIAYQKEVRVRYSWDNWSSNANIIAMYVAGSCDGPTDRFSFGFSVPRHHVGVGDKVFFAVFYKVADQEYWDNNNGLNYLLLIEEDAPRK